MTKEYTCIDSFSGAGGLSLGLQEAGFKILLGFDNDPKCVQTQKLNTKYLNHTMIQADINSLLGGVLLTKTGLKKGELFLLAGGPPCQGFSIQRIGKDEDVRNNLILKYIDLVIEFFPKFFLIENVPGITGKRGKTILELTLQTARINGYHVKKATLDAQDYGVPQRRRRFFVVGERQNLNLPEFEFPPPSVTPERRSTVRDAIAHLPAPPENGSDHVQYMNHRKDKLSEINKARLMSLKAGQGREHLPSHLLANCHKISSSKIGHRNVYGRMNWDIPAPTITARFDSFTRGLFGHPEQTRTISLREGALLQTFPEDYVFAGNKVDIARQIGNAVPPVLGTILGKRIIETYGKMKEKNEF